LEFADDRQRLARDGDESGQLDLPHDEVQQDGDVGEHVARRDEDQDDGQLEVSVLGVRLASGGRRLRRRATPPFARRVTGGGG